MEHNVYFLTPAMFVYFAVINEVYFHCIVWSVCRLELGKSKSREETSCSISINLNATKRAHIESAFPGCPDLENLLRPYYGTVWVIEKNRTKSFQGYYGILVRPF